MKEDILEQVVEDYLHLKGYFTQHNVKFRPAEDHKQFSAKDDSNDSDIDVLAFNPKLRGTDRIRAVSCKSWQGGFSPRQWIEKIDKDGIIFGRDAWRGFRELARPKWGNALINKIEDLTGARKFTYVTAVTKLNGDASQWETHKLFLDNIEGNRIKVLTLKEMLDDIESNVKNTLESSEVGRLLQVIKASGWDGIARKDTVSSSTRIK
jgi:hypothetical protein